MTIRDARPADAAAIRRIVDAAFGQPTEGKLVDELRRSGAAVIELVHEGGEGLDGHILLSRIQSPERCLALAPLSVAPAQQKSGIGAALMREAIRRSQGWTAIFLVGEPAYYSRFGFSLAAAAKFDTVYPKDYMMARALDETAFLSLESRIEYPQAFDGL